jgi:hypothetical protein
MFGMRAMLFVAALGVCAAADTATACSTDAAALTDCGDGGGSTTPEPSSGEHGSGDDGSSSSGLSGGAIAGIVIGALAGLALLVFVVLYFFSSVFEGIGGGAAAWVFAGGTGAPAPPARHAALPFVRAHL